MGAREQYAVRGFARLDHGNSGDPACRGGPESTEFEHLQLGAGFAVPSVMLTLLIILLLLAALGGGFGYSRYGYGSWSPAAIIVLILVVMMLSGRL